MPARVSMGTTCRRAHLLSVSWTIRDPSQPEGQADAMTLTCPVCGSTFVAFIDDRADRATVAVKPMVVI
jgi:hypothetical protein